MKSPVRLMMTTLAALALGACSNGGGGGNDAAVADASTYDGPPRIDKLNLNCGGGARGDQPAVACNDALMSMEMGTRFWVGGRSQCSPDPSAAACQPLCELAVMNADNCTFTAPQSGCPYSSREGFVVVVQTADGRRASTAVQQYDTCSSGTAGMPQQQRWARVAFEDLQNAAACARATPVAGFGAPRYGLTCPTGARDCAMVPAGSATSECCTITLMGGSGMYTASVLTRGCTGDANCGARGRCTNGICLALCGGPCATQLNCDTGFACQVATGAADGVCLPLPP